MGWVSPKVYAILSRSEEGKDILEGIADKDQATVDKEVDAFFGSGGKGSAQAEEYAKAKGKKPKQEEIDEDYERSYGEVPDKEEEPEEYKQYMESYNKWLKNGGSSNNYENDDEETTYANLPHKRELETTVNTLLKEGKNKEQIKNYLKSFPTVDYDEQMDKYVDKLLENPNNEEENKDKPYDFDKWAKETGSQKENHIAYIDTNKNYTPQDVFDIIVSDNDNWNIQGTIADGSKVLFSHKTGPTYTFDKNTGKVELTTKELENKKGLEAHTKELTDYIQNQIKKGATDPETIYQNSPYSIHSHDEMINIANDLLKKSKNETPTISNLGFTKKDKKFENEVVDALKDAVESNNNWIKKYQKLIELNKENKTMVNDFTKKIESFKNENDYFNNVIQNPELMYKK